MTDRPESPLDDGGEPQCQFFVVRKKRLCRMTVRPGRRYCGEHEPQPRVEAGGQTDTRIPCPYDPKHTCYASKLQKHLLICNARQGEVPPYIERDVNAPPAPRDTPCPRVPLAHVPRDTVLRVIDKINALYEEHVRDNIATFPEQPIHEAVAAEFSEASRTESSRRHLRQASALLHLARAAGLVRDHTCYVELGAGKGQVSYFACRAWCPAGSGSGVVAVDRAALRHKRDNKLRAAAGASETDTAGRVRADLRHVALHRLPAAARAKALVGLAKHLCGVATDYALRCVTAPAVVHKTRGLVVATCCHHRCETTHCLAAPHLQELGISTEELNVMLGVVSWATCGDGRSRERRRRSVQQSDKTADQGLTDSKNQEDGASLNRTDEAFDSQNIIDSTKSDESDLKEESTNRHNDDVSGSKDRSSDDISGTKDQSSDDVSGSKDRDGTKLQLSQEYRERVGRRAKALLDWGRVLYLRQLGFDARLYYYVPPSVSLENVCIVASKECTE